MKDTSPLFSTLKTKMEWLHLLMPSEKKLEKYNTLGNHRILFATSSCKVVDRKERKKLMIKHRKKNNAIIQWSQQRKKYYWRKNN